MNVFCMIASNWYNWFSGKLRRFLFTLRQLKTRYALLKREVTLLTSVLWWIAFTFIRNMAACRYLLPFLRVASKKSGDFLQILIHYRERLYNHNFNFGQNKLTELIKIMHFHFTHLANRTFKGTSHCHTWKCLTI